MKIKTLFVACLVFVLLAACSAVPADTAVPPADMLGKIGGAIDFVVGVVLAALDPLGPYLLALAVLLILDFFFGVLASVKNKSFKWEKLPEWYKTKAPLAAGWFVFALLTSAASENQKVVDALGEYGSLVSGGASGLAWLAVVGALGDSIVENVGILIPNFVKRLLGR